LKKEKAILKHQLLPALRDLLLDKDFDGCFGWQIIEMVRTFACETITTILKLGQDNVEDAIQHQIIPLLVELLEDDEELPFEVEALEAIRAAVSTGTPDQIDAMVRIGCIRPLCRCLDLEKCRSQSDERIERTISVALDSLGLILRAGEGRSGTNPMAAKVEASGGLATLRELPQPFYPYDHHPEIAAVASEFLQKYFGDKEESGAGYESEASETSEDDDSDDDGSTASEDDNSDDDSDDDGAAVEPPRQRPRTA
jgi:hypothetical protein